MDVCVSDVSVSRNSRIKWCPLQGSKENCCLEVLKKDFRVFSFLSNLIGQKGPVCTKGPPLYYSKNLVPFGTKFCYQVMSAHAKN